MKYLVTIQNETGIIERYIEEGSRDAIQDAAYAKYEDDVCGVSVLVI